MKGNMMASKKKIASDLPAQKWYRVLPPKWKALYIHLICVANVAGVFEIDLDSFKFHVKMMDEPLTQEVLFSIFGSRIQRIPHHPDKGIIVDYIAFQHTFPKTSQQWAWVEKELAKVGLTMVDVERMRTKVGEQMTLALDEPLTTDNPMERERPQRLSIPPRVEWVAAYCATRNNGVDAQAFCDFYESKGWKVGDQKMKDWQAAVRTWERGRGRGGNATPQSAPVKQSMANAKPRKVF